MGRCRSGGAGEPAQGGHDGGDQPIAGGRPARHHGDGRQPADGHQRGQGLRDDPGPRPGGHRRLRGAVDVDVVLQAAADVHAGRKLVPAGPARRQ